MRLLSRAPAVNCADRNKKARSWCSPLGGGCGSRRSLCEDWASPVGAALKHADAASSGSFVFARSHDAATRGSVGRGQRCRRAGASGGADGASAACAPAWKAAGSGQGAYGAGGAAWTVAGGRGQSRVCRPSGAAAARLFGADDRRQATDGRPRTRCCGCVR